jgi:hypothetical protein
LYIKIQEWLLKQSYVKIVFTFDVFFSAETTCIARWLVFYIRKGTFQSTLWPYDSHMTGRAGVWEADDIVKFYIALFFPATL